MGENCSEHQVKRLVPLYPKKKSQVYKVSSGVNSQHGQVAWRKFGNVLRKETLKVLIVLSHINSEKKS